MPEGKRSAVAACVLVCFWGWSGQNPQAFAVLDGRRCRCLYSELILALAWLMWCFPRQFSFFPLFLWVKGMEGDTVSLSSSSQPCLLLTHHRGGEGQRQGQMDSPRRSLTLGKGNRCRTQAGLRDLAGEADNIPVHTYNMYTHI